MTRKEKNDELRRAILRQWDTWAPANDMGDAATGMAFFNYLQVERPDLLEFKYPGDKWQCVHGWLERGARWSARPPKP